MDADRHLDELATIFEQALKRPVEERAAFLDEACRDDPTLRAELDSLLVNYEDAPAFFERLGDVVPALPRESPPLAPEADPYHLIGTTVAQYHIVEKLGRGGMGIVYKAEDTRLRRTVALKFLPPMLGQDIKARQRFSAEAQAASALDHTNICTVYEIGETEQGQVFIAMAHYEGETLKAKIKRGPLPLDEALGYAAQMARGLARAHAKGIIHRDIKPANVIVTNPVSGDEGRGVVKILDFGLAKMADVQLTRTGTTMGTVAYMSPEQMRGEAVDHRADIWSLGVVLFEMLTGERPFRGDYEQALMYSVLNEEPKPLRTLDPEASEDAEHIVAMCLEKDAAHRYPTVADLLADLGVLVQDSQTGTGVVSRAARKRPGKMRPLILAGAGALAVLLVAVVAAMILGGTKPSGKQGLAVLPFKNNLGETPENQALADGLMQSLTGMIARMETVRDSLWVVPAEEVVSRGVVTPGEAGKLFGVNQVVTGTLQRLGQETELILNLIDPKKTTQLLDSRTITAPLGPAFRKEAVEALEDLLGVRLDARTRQAARADGPATPGASAFYLQGRGFLQRYDKAGNLDNAIILFNQVLEEDSLYALAHAGLCEARWRKYQQMNNTALADQALDDCDRAAALADQQAPVLVTLGSIYLMTGASRKAEETLKQALDLEPENADAYRWLGRVYEDLGLVDKAEDAYQQAIALKPHLWIAYSAYGAMLYNIGRYEDAEGQFEQVTRLTPDNYLGYNDLGIVQDHFNQIDQAIESFMHSIALQPNVHAYRNLGDLHFRHQQYGQAVDALEKACALNNDDWIAWGWLGHARYWAGNVAGAQTAWQRVIELGAPLLAINPKNDDVLIFLAEAHAARGEKEQGFTYLQRLLALPHDDLLTKYYIGRLYEMLGYREAALDYIEQVLESGFDPGTPDRDPWLEALRETSRYQALRSQYLETIDNTAT